MSLTPIELLKANAPARRPAISLCEGTDPRIVEGAVNAVELGLADVLLVGPQDEVAAELARLGKAASNHITLHDPSTSDLTESFAQTFYSLRKHKGVDLERARLEVTKPSVYAAMLVREGHAHGTLGGAVHTTGAIVRAALQAIGVEKDAPLVSSFFLMFPPDDAPEGARPMIYSDCGLVIDPNAEELAAIAAASATSCRSLLKIDPVVAMLSFSTKGSAAHPHVEKMNKAAALLKEKRPDLPSDGEFQFDAAFVPSVGRRKAPGSSVAGQANVMIFPDLDAGNIAYKITQRIGGYAAIGPILQGLNKPANDLSRGCSASDVTEMIAVTALQSLG